MERLRAFAIAALAVGAVGTIGAPVASAAPSGDVAITCGQATYHYTGFEGTGPHTVQETIYEDTGGELRNRLRQVEFTFTGSSADHVVDFALDPGPHTLRGDSWNYPGGQVSGFDARPQYTLCEAPPDRRGDVEITCGKASYHYDGFDPNGTHTVQETIYEDTGGEFWNRLKQVEFTFTGSSADHVVDFDLPTGPHTMRADSWHYPSGGHISGFAPPRPQAVECAPPPPCPSGEIAMRWQYTHLGRLGSGSATKSLSCPGPTTLEGSISGRTMKLAPGEPLAVGSSFRAPVGPITVARAQVEFTISCASGQAPSASTWTVRLPTRAYDVKDGNWLSVAQVAAVMPNFCSGGRVRLGPGGGFSARFR